MVWTVRDTHKKIIAYGPNVWATLRKKRSGIWINKEMTIFGPALCRGRAATLRFGRTTLRLERKRTLCKGDWLVLGKGNIVFWLQPVRNVDVEAMARR